MKLIYKILLTIVVPITIVSVVFIIFIQNLLYKEVENRFLQSIENSTVDYANLISLKLNSISETASYNVKLIQENSNLSSKKVIDILNETIKYDSIIYGASVYFDTTYTGNLNKTLFYSYRNETQTKTIQFNNLTNKYKEYFSNNFSWWAKPKKTQKPIWTSPYYDKGAGEKTMITYAAPFFIDGNYAGVTSVDILLGDIGSLLLINEKRVEGDFDPTLFVLNASDSIVIFSEKKEAISKHAISNSISEPIYSKNTKLSVIDLVSVLETGSGVVTNASGQRYFVFWSPIVNCDWIVINILNVSSAHTFVYEAISKIIILLIVFITVLVIIIFATSRIITKPLTKLSDLTIDISNGNYEREIATQRKDEIGTLANNFSLMTHKLKDREQNLKDANKKLLVLDEAKNQFLQLISHEIRTPLNGIVGSTHFLSNMIKDPELKDFLDMLMESVDRLDEFSKIALEITQMQTVGRERDKTNFSLNEVVTKVLESKLSDAKKKQCTLEALYSSSSNIIAIEDYTLRTVEELVNNAIKFSNENSVINIKTLEDNGEIKLIISDTGEIIPPNKIEEITKPFGLAKDHYDKDIGLGLAYVKTYLDIHDASMKIVSNEEKTEITLIFNIP